jgi:hypothetical protein
MITFVKTAKGKQMPCNSARVDYVEDAAGYSRVLTEGGHLVDCFITDGPGPGTGKGYIPHFHTCRNPEAAKALAAAKKAPSARSSMEGYEEHLKRMKKRKSQAATAESSPCETSQLSLFA